MPAAMKHMVANFSKLDKFEGVNFRRWQKKMHFLLSTMSVVYVDTPIHDAGDDATVELFRRRNYGVILNDFKHTLKHKNEELTLVELGSHLRIEESFTVQDSDKPKGNNVVGPSVVNMVEHNNSTKYNDNMGKRKHQDTKADPNKKSKDDDVAWWVDLGAIVHMCKDRCWFKTYESLNDGSILHVGNESTALVHERGCVDLRLSSGKIVSFDLCDLHATPSLENKKYFVTLIDDASRFCYVYLLHSNDEALDKFKVFKTEVELQQGSLIKRFRTDRRDDIIESIISCVSAKEIWTDLVYSFKCPSDTKENRIMDLKLEHQTFRAKSTESLSQTYTRYKTLLNELANDGVNLSKHEINVDFVNSLLEKWLTFSEGLRNANHTQTLDLADIYGRSSEEYLRDLDIGYHERDLLGNSKCFIKRRNNFSDQKANENTKCYKCGNKGHFARDFFSKTSEPYKSPVNNYSLVSKGFQPKFTPKIIQSSSNSINQADPKFQKDYKAEYKKMKAKHALLEASPSKVSDKEDSAATLAKGLCVRCTMVKSRHLGNLVAEFNVEESHVRSERLKHMCLHIIPMMFLEPAEKEDEVFTS
ncbi:retrovirus-related pol polyprotein from transposon TNT 1-94 [Tanacetum coccineum]